MNGTAAPHFESFLADLEAHGYKVNSLGGYNRRYKAGGGGWSQHAYGNAIDINPASNAFHRPGVTDMPSDISTIAARHGLSWGGDWRNPDYMHFEYTGIEPRFRPTPPEQRGQMNHVEVVDHSGSVEIHHDSYSIGPREQGSIWRFGH